MTYSLLFMKVGIYKVNKRLISSSEITTSNSNYIIILRTIQNDKSTLQ